MSAPRWTSAVLRRLAASKDGEADILVGDLEEAHRARVARRGVVVAMLLTSLETIDIALMLMRRRVRLPRPGMSWLDLKLGVRMLVRYPVLTVIGSGSLALAIAIGAAAFAFISLMLWPRLPLPDGDQIVMVQQSDQVANQPEPRVVADSCAGAAARRRSATLPPAAVWPATCRWATASSNRSWSPK